MKPRRLTRRDLRSWVDAAMERADAPTKEAARLAERDAPVALRLLRMARAEIARLLLRRGQSPDEVDLWRL